MGSVSSTIEPMKAGDAMTFRQLQYFLEVARTLNFSKAAEALFVSQSTLSKAISTLEEELGAVLFLRDHHNVKLTPAGAVLATNLPRLQEDLNKTIDLVQEVKEGMRGRLALGIQEGFSLPEIIVSAIDYCKYSMPFLSITATGLDDAALEESLANGRIDFALSYQLEEDLASDESNGTLTVLESAPAVLCVSNMAKTSDQPTAKELSKLSYLFAAPDDAPRVRRWAEYCRNLGFYPDISSVRDVGTVSAKTELGMAATIVPQGHSLTRSPNIRTLPIADAYRVSSVMTSNPDNLNQIVEVFTKLIESDL